MSLVFRPVGIVLGILGGMVAQKLFDFVWSKVDEEEAPDPEHRDVPWGKFLIAMVVQGEPEPEPE